MAALWNRIKTISVTAFLFYEIDKCGFQDLYIAHPLTPHPYLDKQFFLLEAYSYLFVISRSLKIKVTFYNVSILIKLLLRMLLHIQHFKTILILKPVWCLSVDLESLNYGSCFLKDKYIYILTMRCYLTKCCV